MHISTLGNCSLLETVLAHSTDSVLAQVLPVQEGAKVFIRFNHLLPDSYETVKAIARRAEFRQPPTFADILENAAATTGPGGHWDKAVQYA